MRFLLVWTGCLLLALTAIAQSDRGKPIVTFVHGPSGIGKTTLVEHFVAELRQGEGAVALKGRCYERETVPFKAFDNLIERFKDTKHRQEYYLNAFCCAISYQYAMEAIKFHG